VRPVYKRSLQILLVVIVAVTMLGAGSPSTRFDQVGHKLMCTCGCAQILLECNHVGCPDSPTLIAELRSQINAGATDTAIFQAFASKYGPTVLAAPFRGGFDDVAWIVPFVVLILGILAIVLLLRMWQRRHARLAPALPEAPRTPEQEALRARIRNETKYGE
jgi:cytochrome c-type biogenesis protein CcmH/NrfF